VIVVGGEALVDLVPARPNTAISRRMAPSDVAQHRHESTYGGEAGGAGATGPPGLGPLLPQLGGGPFNVAVALGRLGAPAALLASLSTDAFGTAQLAQLEASGVNTSLVRRAPQPTALALATVQPDGSAAYTFHTAGTAAVAFTDPGPLPPSAVAVSLGSLGLLLEPAATGYEAVLHRESAAGRLVALDPNVRPDLVGDAAAYRARFRSWLPSVGLLKLSVEDAAWLADAPDPRPAIAGWLRAGPRAVVLTRGAGGLTVSTASGLAVSVPAVPVAVADTIGADTIGAGDTVHAALLARLHAAGALDLDLDADGWRDVLTFAARAAAVTCSRPGADPPWAAEM